LQKKTQSWLPLTDICTKFIVSGTVYRLPEKIFC